ncbi:hypothetical protein ACWEPC_37590, partial [Nonomuraea sp. NPDC004297]
MHVAQVVEHRALALAPPGALGERQGLPVVVQRLLVQAPALVDLGQVEFGGGLGGEVPVVAGGGAGGLGDGLPVVGSRSAGPRGRRTGQLGAHALLNLSQARRLRGKYDLAAVLAEQALVLYRS